MPILKYSETQTDDSQFCSAEAHGCTDSLGGYKSSTNNNGSKHLITTIFIFYMIYMTWYYYFHFSITNEKTKLMCPKITKPALTGLAQ